jgi:hypothetical protein
MQLQSFEDKLMQEQTQQKKVTSPGQNKSKPQSAEQRQNEIQQRAYDLYVQRGREPGRESEDWLQAERECFQRDQGQKAA